MQTRRRPICNSANAPTAASGPAASLADGNTATNRAGDWLAERGKMNSTARNGQIDVCPRPILHKRWQSCSNRMG
eukprot:11162006-Lingulodinium_polyedra.AAC.1